MNLKELIQDTTEQRTLPWYRARLGKITGSSVFKIMGKGKGKPYTNVGEKYLHKVRSERRLDPDMVKDDRRFGDYINRTQKSSKAIEWGIEHEDEARVAFHTYVNNHDKDLKDFFGGLACKTVGSCAHHNIDGFNSSPDGLLVDAEGYIMAALEIKCPEPETHDEYWDIISAEELKKIKPDYYWQCFSHMAVTGANACFFISYDLDSSMPLHYILIPKDDEEIEMLEDRVNTSIKGIGNLKKLFKP